MRNMQDELSGPITMHFVGGDILDAIVDTVVVDDKAHPIYLMEENNIFNWSTITRVQRR